MPLRHALLALCLMGATSASAQDLGAALENWTETFDGGIGRDAGYGVVIDTTGAVVLVGETDAGAQWGSSGLVWKVDHTGADVWTSLKEPVDPISANKPYSNDIVWDVEITPTDDLCVVGQWSGPESATYQTGFWLAKLQAADGELVDTDGDGVGDFQNVWQDGGASVNQAAFGIDLDNAGDLFVTGWSFRSATQSGQWASHKFVGSTATRSAGPFYYNYDAEIFALDQAFDVAVDSQGNLIVVGAIGEPGATGADDANRNFHVRKIDPAGNLIWEDTWVGTAGLDDVATAVVVDNVDEITVVGYTNKGTDNGANADYDWLIVRYDDQPSTGTTGNRLWEYSWQDATAPGPKERAYDAHMAFNGSDVVVGGTWDDGGVSGWRVAVHSWIDGSVVSEWTRAAQAEDTEVRAIDMRDATVAIAGTSWNGTDYDAEIVILDPDDDSDGVGNRLDGCPLDATKLEPGECGCGSPDIDSDYDTYLDCNDACPQLAEKWDDPGVCGCDEEDLDGDGDGTPDCIDNCPTDPNKISLGECGCNLPDDDSDGDGVLGCDDACSNTPAGTDVDENGCPPEICDNADDDDNDGREDCEDPDCATDPACSTGGADDDDLKGCGCSTSGSPATGLLGLGLLALAVRRREQR